MIEQHEHAVTGIDWSKPAPEPLTLSHLQPGWDEIPIEHKHGNFVSPPSTPARAGIDPDAALRHLDEIRESWQYAFEHKSAALSWLTYLWFEDEASDQHARLDAVVNASLPFALIEQRSAECIKMLEIVGCDKLGFGNTLVGMVQAACREIIRLRENKPDA